MRSRFIGYALSLLIRALPIEAVKELIDDLLDPLEDKYKDNATVMQAIGFLRAVMSIPDDIGGDED